MMDYARKSDPAALEHYIDSQIPMKRIASPDEQAGAILWLCSAESSFVTGHTLAVDGGTLAK